LPNTSKSYQNGEISPNLVTPARDFGLFSKQIRQLIGFYICMAQGGILAKG